MPKRICFCLLILATIGALFSVPVFAAPNFKWGASERARYEFWKNISDMDNTTKDNRSYFRFKTCLWGQMDFNKDTSLYAKLTNENKAYTYFFQSASRKKGFHYMINEVVFDNLYLDLKKFLGLPLDLRLGRQDFLGMYGEGFLIADGTPQDGSRTYYFNAVKAAWNIDPQNTLDFIYIADNRTDDMLPIINGVKGEQLLNSSDEQAYILYHKNDAVKNLHWENYYIYKFEDSGGETAASRMTKQSTRLNTIGSFAKYSFSPWALRGQFAEQIGKYGDNDREGYGGYLFLDRDLKNTKWSPSLSAGFIYLSGDDQSTSKNEAWDPLFSRYPWMSELYVLAYPSETETGYWTNLQMYRTSLVLQPTKKLKLSLCYNFLRANEQVAAATTLFSGTGKNRGHLPQVKLDYAFNKYVTSYVLAEYLFPGNFYTDKLDGSLFFRTEIQVKF